MSKQSSWTSTKTWKKSYITTSSSRTPQHSSCPGAQRHHLILYEEYNSSNILWTMNTKKQINFWLDDDAPLYRWIHPSHYDECNKKLNAWCYICIVFNLKRNDLWGLKDSINYSTILRAVANRFWNSVSLFLLQEKNDMGRVPVI